MKIQRTILTVLTAILFTGAALAAPKSRVKERGEILIGVTFTATVDAPVGATATGEIDILKKKFHREGSSDLTLTLTGLAAGSYSVDATVAGVVDPVHLGDVLVTTPVPGVPDAPVELDIDAETASHITALTITDSASAFVIFDGEVEVLDADWWLIAHVRVTGPEDEGGNLAPNRTTKGGFKGKKGSSNEEDSDSDNSNSSNSFSGRGNSGHGKPGRGVFGHAVVKSFTRDNVEFKRQFLWVAKGAPANTTLDINVDGVVVGTVTSTHRGSVFIRGIDESVVLRDMHLVTLTDSTGAVVMQGDFEPEL